MRRALFYAASLVVAAAILIVLATLLGAFWAGLARSRTIAAWCTSAHISWFAPYAPIVWLRIPFWVTIAIGGAILGLKRPGSWLLDSTLLGLLFVVGWYAWPRLVWGPIIRMPPWQLWLLNSSSVPLIVAVSFLAQRFVQRRSTHCDDHPHCKGCDYDLHENTTGICPECGTLIEATNPATAIPHHPEGNGAG